MPEQTDHVEVKLSREDAKNVLWWTASRICPTSRRLAPILRAALDSQPDQSQETCEYGCAAGEIEEPVEGTQVPLKSACPNPAHHRYVEAGPAGATYSAPEPCPDCSQPDPAPRPKQKHGMLPGSHEQPEGPECRCGAAWSVWEDRCVGPQPEDQPPLTEAQERALDQKPLPEDDPVPTPQPNDECISCGEGNRSNECPKSKRPCGHHCNCSWINDRCHWCGKEFGEVPAPQPEGEWPEIRTWLREEITDVLEIERTQGLSMWGEARKATLLAVRDRLVAYGQALEEIATGRITGGGTAQEHLGICREIARKALSDEEGEKA